MLKSFVPRSSTFVGHSDIKVDNMFGDESVGELFTQATDAPSGESIVHATETPSGELFTPTTDAPAGESIMHATDAPADD